MAMTRTRIRRQKTLTFLAEQLMAVERELGLQRSKTSEDEAAGQHLRSLEARRLALVEAMRQFDPELEVGAISGVGCGGGDGHG